MAVHHLFLAVLLISCCLFSLVRSGAVRFVEKFQDIAEAIQANPYSLQVVMVTSSVNCNRCAISEEIYSDFADSTEGIILAYMLDCEKVWAILHERERVPACNPRLKDKLPHLTFFQPMDGLDLYNKDNRRGVNDIPYTGLLSKEALTQKVKELFVSSNLKKVSNFSEIEEFISYKDIPYKFVLFTDEDSAPLYFRAVTTQFRGQIDVTIPNILPNLVQPISRDPYQFAIVDGDNKKIRRKFNLSTLPSLQLLRLPEETDGEMISKIYEGEHTVKNLAQYLQSKLEEPNQPKRKKVTQGVYFELSRDVDVQHIRSNTILSVLKKDKESFILLNIGQSSVDSNKIMEKIKSDFGPLLKYYTVECLDRECEPYSSSSRSSLIVYGIGGSRKLSDFVLVEEYISKDQLSAKLLAISGMPCVRENVFQDAGLARKAVRETVAEKQFSVIFFQEDSQPFSSLLFYAASQQQRFKKYLNFVRIANPSQTTLEEWGEVTSPGVITILQLNILDGSFRRAAFEFQELDYVNLIGYFNQRVVQKQDEIVDSTKIEEIRSHEDFEKLCLGNDDKTCIIALLDHTKQGKLAADLEKLDKIRKIYADRDYTFVQIDAKCHRELLQLFRIPETDLNTVLLFNHKKDKYRLLKVALEIDNLIKFFGEMKGKIPRGMLSPLPGTIDIDERNCAAFNESEKVKIEAKKMFKREKKFQTTEL